MGRDVPLQKLTPRLGGEEEEEGARARAGAAAGAAAICVRRSGTRGSSVCATARESSRDLVSRESSCSVLWSGGGPRPPEAGLVAC